MSNETNSTKRKRLNNLQDEVEAERIILTEEYEENYYKIKRELIGEKWFIDLVEMKAKNKLKQKYPNIEFEDNRIAKKQKKNSCKKIVLTGTIRAGKTTFSLFMLEYLKNKGLKVFIPEEILLQIKDNLDLFCKDKEKYVFFFQDLIIDIYKKMMKNIDSVTDDYDIIILDRTYLDTEVFTNINFDDDLKSFYLKTKCDMIDSHDFDYVFYVKSSEDTSIKRQKERNRKGEIYSEEYMRKVYREYERIIDKMYPKHTVFDTEEDVYVKEKDRYVLDKDGKKQINKQVLDNYH